MNNPLVSSLLLLLLAVILIGCIRFQWRRRHLYRHASKVPGPRGWPIFGICFSLMGNPASIFNTVMSICETYPDLLKVWFGPILIYAVAKPEYLEKILTSPKAFSKMYFYKFSEPIGGHGLFAAPVPTWKRHRKIIMPAFNQRVLDGFVEIFGRQSTVMGHNLMKFVGDEEFDLFETVSKCTLDIICETAMGITIGAQSTSCDFYQWVDRLLEITFLRMFVFCYHFDLFFKWTRLYQEQKNLLEKFHTFTGRVVKERRLQFDHNPHLASNKSKAFLDLLLELSTGDNKLTDEELKDEVNTFMIAGSDTTASSTCFAFLMLGMHPHVQDKLFQEVIEVLGPNRTIEPQDLSLLLYTERVIKETLRLFPVGAFVVRDVQDDLQLSDTLVIPNGSSVLIGIMPAHRNPNTWPSPLTFNPDRFLPEEVSKRHPFSYLPFSMGPRNCIGPRYAMMSMKTMIATTIRQYRFSTSYKRVEDVKLKTNLVLRPRDGFKVTVHLRE